MKKIITLIITSLIALSVITIPKSKIVKADNETTIQFMYKNTITTEEDNKLNAMGNTGSASNVKNTTTGIMQSTNNNIVYIITTIYYYKYENMNNQYGGRTITISGNYGNINNTTQWETFMIRYDYNQNENQEYDYIESWTTTSSVNTNPITIAEFYEREWRIIDTTIYNSTTFQNTKNIMWKDIAPKLETPIIELSFQTIRWATIENAQYYIVYKNGNIVGQTEYNQWATIENGNYQIQACTNNENHRNSNLSNTINQNNYNDMIGNGTNWYTFMSAWIDTTIYLLKSMLNYEIWGINFFALLQLIITIVLTWIIIKFIIGL